MNQITAPYGFVPLSQDVHLPDWLKVKDGAMPPVHDVPFEDGLCGTLELEIEAETPIFFRGAKSGQGAHQPFTLSDGRYAIPGASLRGALRNVVEIITFSRFNRVNNHRYTVRDLTPGGERIYRQHMAAIEGGKLTPLVNAGWMTKQDSDETPAVIALCDFAKVEYQDLRGIAKMLGDDDFRPGIKRGADIKYSKYRGKLKAELPILWTRPPSVEGRKMWSRHGKVSQSSKEFFKGQLVFTGQPQEWNAGDKRKKHHDFFFTNEAFENKTFEVPKATFLDFEFGHSNRGKQNRLSDSLQPNAEWGYWKQRFENGERVPVFFLTQPDGLIRSFGLAMMFRLPYDLSIHQAIKNASPEHLPDPTANFDLDFAEGLFGTVRDNNNGRGRGLALKGRVGISHALAQGSPALERPVSAILGAPKASYYPNYVEQNAEHPGSAPGTSNGRQVYQTWMDPDARPRGWKRYKTLETPSPSAASFGRENHDVTTTFTPVRAGTKFTCHVDIHNLRPVELGALLWAITLGGDKSARHNLGMARPLGYGRCVIRLANSMVVDMTGRRLPTLDSIIQEFQAYMESKLPGWASSHQVRELIALARPVPNSEARYQTLSPNQFAAAKGLFLALPSAAGLGLPKGWTKAGAQPAGSRPSAPRGEAANGEVITAQLIVGETTKAGGPLFQSPSLRGKANLVQASSKPDGDFKPNVAYQFVVIASGGKPQIKWLDPAAPPPAVNDNKKPGPGNRPGYYR